MPLLAPIPDEIADDQEVADEAGLLDHLQFQLQPIDHLPHRRLNLRFRHRRELNRARRPPAAASDRSEI